MSTAVFYGSAPIERFRIAYTRTENVEYCTSEIVRQQYNIVGQLDRTTEIRATFMQPISNELVVA